MAKAFSLASWNVEHFRGEKNRTARVVDFMSQQNPDVFALLEVEGKDVYGELVKSMPNYQFHITEGPQIQEALVGVKRNLTAFFTQKVEYKTGNSALRPGALLTLRIDGADYSILFLHTKSSSNPVGLGIRDDQFSRAFKFKGSVLDKASGGKGKANFLFLGDLNTMGMKYPFDLNITPETELRKLDGDAKKKMMKRLTKNSPHTWWNGPGSSYKPANLDHVVASEHLTFKQFGGSDIDVRGWPKLGTDAAKGTWIKHYSDHGLIYLEVQRTS